MEGYTLILASSNYMGGKVYDVLAGGVRVGAVEQVFPTFERKPQGSRIVTKRWTAKKPYWRVSGDMGRYAMNYETRKRAVEALLGRSKPA